MTKPPSWKSALKSKIAVAAPHRLRNHRISPKKQELRLSETGWISALDAAQLLAANDGNLASAKSLLAESMQEGMLSCRAYCWCQEADIGSVNLGDIEWSGYTPSRERKGQIDKNVLCMPGEEESHVDVTRDVFLKTSGWEIAPDDVRWSDGLFVARRPAEFLPNVGNALSTEMMIRRFVYHLQFHVSEIGVLIPSTAANGPNENCDNEEPTELAIDSYLSGRARDPWSIWVATVVTHALDGRITTGKGAMAKLMRLADKRLVALGLKSPSRSRIYPAASAVIHELEKRDLSQIK